jgi:hypothetical protein
VLRSAAPTQLRRPVAAGAAELEAEVAKLRKEMAVERMEKEVPKNGATRSSAALLNRNSMRVHWAARRSVAECSNGKSQF